MYPPADAASGRHGRAGLFIGMLVAAGIGRMF
jgi:hypothetical protein